MQHFHDGQHHIQTDQVGQRQRSDGMVAAQLHALVDLDGTGHAVLQREDSLVDHRAQQAVNDETGRIAHADGRLAQLMRQPGHGVEGGLRGLQAADDLHQRHHRHGVEEVHAHKAGRILQRRSQAGDGDGGGVGGQNGLGTHHGLHVAQHLRLDALPFGGGLDHQVSILERCRVGGAADARQRGCLASLIQLLLPDEPVQRRADGRQSAFDGLGHDVLHHHVQTGLSRGLRNAVAHRAGANHAQCPDRHVSCLLSAGMNAVAGYARACRSSCC